MNKISLLILGLFIFMFSSCISDFLDCILKKKEKMHVPDKYHIIDRYREDTSEVLFTSVYCSLPKKFENKVGEECIPSSWK